MIELPLKIIRQGPLMSIRRSGDLTFEKLVNSIQDIHQNLSIQAGKAINISLTTRNWLIGAYITEFQLRGSDRAKYGESLFFDLSKHLKKTRGWRLRTTAIV